MLVYHKPKQSGKTIDLIKMSAQTGYYIVAANHQRIDQIMYSAAHARLSIPQPLTIEEVVMGQYYGRGIKGFLMDDLDYVMNVLFKGKLHVATIDSEFITDKLPELALKENSSHKSLEFKSKQLDSELTSSRMSLKNIGRNGRF